MSDKENVKHLPEFQGNNVDDEEFGGVEERKRMERRLLRKLDVRMSITIVIYILNYVRCQSYSGVSA